MTIDLSYIDVINRPMFDRIAINFHQKSHPLSVSYYERCELLESGKIIENREVPISLNGIYLGTFLNIWGHCITDNLKRFWFLLTPEYQILKSQEYKLVCTLQSDTSFSKNFTDLISFFDLKASDILIVKDATVFSNLVVPEDSLDENHRYTAEFKQTIDYIRDKVRFSGGSPKKIYFSRTQLSQKGRDFGEISVERAFKKLGYTIIYPERLSLIDQLILLKSCDSFAATDGSVAHNAMFCRDGIECIVVSKKVNPITYQCSIMGMRDFKSYYIDAHLSIFVVFATWFGPFFMYANDNLVKFCKDRNVDIEWYFPKWLFLKYCMSCFWQFVRYRLHPRVVPEWRYYCSVLKKNIARSFN